MQPKDLPDISLPEGYEETIGSQEEILERARQEAIVQRRVIELRKQGQWSQRRLPKVWFAVFLHNILSRLYPSSFEINCTAYLIYPLSRLRFDIPYVVKSNVLLLCLCARFTNLG